MQQKTLLEKIQWVLWGLLIFSLPITSFPLVTGLAGGSMVGPASLIPLVGLLLIWGLPFVLKGGALPRQVVPLFAFLLAALISSLRSFFLAIPPFQSAQVWRQVLEGVGTLLIGVGFFTVSAAWPITEQRLQKTLRWVNWSGLAVLLWSLLQDAVWEIYVGWPAWVRAIQGVFSSGTLFRDRVVGFTYEPSWLAHQLVMLYLPMWLAATVLKQSAHPKKLLGLSLENLLLAGAVFLLYLSKSRLGLLAFLLCAAFLLFEYSLKMATWLRSKFRNAKAKRWAVAGFYLGLLLLLIFVLLGSGYYLSRADPRMQQFFDLQTLREKSFLEYAEQLAFSARIVYWQAGWEVFGEQPWLGVGLGNAGFYFYDKLDPYAWKLIEVRNYMFNFTSPPNIKSLWMRLLAETGIIGFTFWAVWLLQLLLTTFVLRRKSAPLQRRLGLSALLTLVALLVDGFSLDTFALPYYWVSFGLMVAAFSLPTHALPATEEQPAEEILN